MKPNYVKNVFSWEHMCIYLSGAIDAAQDAGKGWRDEWVEGLGELGIEHNQILNPCRKPLKNAPFDFDDEQFATKQYRDTEQWDKLCDIMSQIAHMDLRFVDKSDVILANFPKAHGYHDNVQIPTYGTIHEIVVARQQRKPVYIVWEGGKKECSAWLMWLVGHDHVFDTFENLQKRLRQICMGQIEYNANDWLLLDLGR